MDTRGLIEVAVTDEGLSGVVRVDLDGDVVVNVHVAPRIAASISPTRSDPAF